MRNATLGVEKRAEKRAEGVMGQNALRKGPLLSNGGRKRGATRLSGGSHQVVGRKSIASCS